MKFINVSGILALGAFAVVSSAWAKGFVIDASQAPVKTHPSGALVKMLATPKHQGTKSAFISVLEVPANGKVPEHKDKSEEYLYVLEGTGQIWIDGEKFSVQPGHLVYMPSKAKVRFHAGPNRVKVLQIFAPLGSEKKYDKWQAKGEQKPPEPES